MWIRHSLEFQLEYKSVVCCATPEMKSKQVAEMKVKAMMRDELKKLERQETIVEFLVHNVPWPKHIKNC